MANDFQITHSFSTFTQKKIEQGKGSLFSLFTTAETAQYKRPYQAISRLIIETVCSFCPAEIV